MSFYTSLSGLKAAQTDLSVISNNVANVGTVGFKRSRTEFGDLISASPLQSQTVPGQGTVLKSIQQQFSQGGFSNSERALDLGISGQGFFVTRGDLSGGKVTYTRNGSFGLDSQGYIKDARGAFLQALPVDQQGVITATGLAATRNVQVPQTSGVSRATTEIDLSVSLPSDADLPAQRAVYGNSNPYVFDRFDPNSYNFSTAGSVFDVAGNELPATIYYTRTSYPTSTDNTTQWEARVFVGNTEVSGATPMNMTFDATGNLTGGGSATFNDIQPDGAAAPMSLTVDFGTTTRQSSAQFSLRTISQDGYAAGQLDNVSVDTEGLIVATYSNGDSIPLGKVALANFANPGGLRQLGNASWAASGISGEPIIAEAGQSGFGAIQSGALEQANVDVTEELVALISAQRNFQANAKAIETANALTQTIVQLR